MALRAIAADWLDSESDGDAQMDVTAADFLDDETDGGERPRVTPLLEEEQKTEREKGADEETGEPRDGGGDMPSEGERFFYASDEVDSDDEEGEECENSGVAEDDADAFGAGSAGGDSSSTTPRTVRVLVNDAPDARRGHVEVSPPLMISRGKNTERQSDAELPSNIIAWQDATCGCVLHGGSCFAFLFKHVGYPLILAGRSRRYAITRSQRSLEFDVWVKEALTIQEESKATSRLMVTLKCQAHGHRICKLAYWHAVHTSPRTILPAVRAVARSIVGAVPVPRRLRNADGPVMHRSQLADIAAQWITERVLALSQAAPNLAQKTSGLGLSGKRASLSAEDLDHSDLDIGQLQMRQALLVCVHCSRSRTGGRRVGVCSPPQCEYSRFVGSRDDLDEAQIAGPGCFRQRFNLRIKELGIQVRTKFSVSADCYLCDHFRQLRTSARHSGDYITMAQASAGLSHHHWIHQTRIKAEILRLRQFAVQFTANPETAPFRLWHGDDDCGTSHKVCSPWHANQDGKGANNSQHLLPLKMFVLVAAGLGVNVTLAPAWVETGTNFTLTARLMALVEMKRRAQRLPDVLYLQSDGGDGNWLPHVFGFAGMLVHAKVVSRVRISRHLPEHGHDIADSTIAAAVQFRFGTRKGAGNSSRSVSEWMDQLTSIYQRRLLGEVQLLGAVFDFQTYLKSTYHEHFGDGFGFLAHKNGNKIGEPIQVTCPCPWVQAYEATGGVWVCVCVCECVFKCIANMGAWLCGCVCQSCMSRPAIELPARLVSASWAWIPFGL